MKKKANINELVWAKKDGYAKRQFTLQQLEAMGTDTPDGDSYDGWKVVAEAKEPKEVKEAKATVESKGVSGGKGDIGVPGEEYKPQTDEKS